MIAMRARWAGVAALMRTAPLPPAIPWPRARAVPQRRCCAASAAAGPRRHASDVARRTGDAPAVAGPQPASVVPWLRELSPPVRVPMSMAARAAAMRTDVVPVEYRMVRHWREDEHVAACVAA